jgi:adenosylcobinamide-GDP ribazoletransferase
MDPSVDDAAHAALGQHRAANAPAALLAQLAAATRFLTIVPLGGRVAPIGESALFFPLVGLALGGVLVLLDRATAPIVPLVVRDVLLVAALALLSGGRHLHGLARAARGLVVADRARALAVMREGGACVLGAVAIAVVLVLKVVSLGALPVSTRAAALLYAPMLARWSMVVLAFGSRPARPDGVGRTMVSTVKFREFGVATVGALWIILAYTAARGLLAILVVAVVTISCRIFVHARLGGVTGDLLGAIVEINETLVLATFTLAAG